MRDKIENTHPANLLLGTLLLARDYAGKAWHAVFGPLVTECVDYAKTVRACLNRAAAESAELNKAIADATKDDGVVDEKEVVHIRRRLADLNRRLATGSTAAN